MQQSGLPSGTVTFLFTDIEASTQLWERDRRTMRDAVERHLVILRAAVAARGGTLFKVVGDATQSAFPTAPAAVAAALDAAIALHGPDETASAVPLSVRMALHAGEAEPLDGDYLAPCLNRLSRLLTAGHGGQILLSTAVADLAGEALPAGTRLRDLGEHRLRDLFRAERVYQVLDPRLHETFPPLRSIDLRPHNLAPQPTAFLGRESEVGQLVDLVRSDGVRLVTLTGPGGVGKTRLAMQAAADLLDEFDDGVFVVELAPLSDPGLVLAAIGTAVGVRDEGGRPLAESLRGFLRGRQLLLVLDNFEHLLAAATTISDLLRDAPGVKVLATSRSPLHLRGERETPVQPMAVPDLALHESMQRLSQYEAVRLFIARAQDARPDFTVTNETAPAVAEICARLDGVPLAIELAAARVKLLPPQALLARLERRLPLLARGSRDAPARQQTLRDTIAWGHDLLSLSDRTLFRRLAVFSGGFTMDAAETIADSDQALDVFVGLAALVDASLIRQSDLIVGEPRFSFLETIREFGIEQLDASGEAANIRRRHATWVLSLVAQSEVDGSLWLWRLEAERANLRAAFEWAVTGGDPELALGLVAGLERFYLDPFTSISEVRDWAERALAGGPSGPDALRTRVLNMLGGTASLQRDFETARSRATEALLISREIGDRGSEAHALATLSSVSRQMGDFDRAALLGEELLTVFRRGLMPAEPPFPLWILAYAEFARGRRDRARSLFVESLAICRRAGDAHWIADNLNCLGDLDCFDQNVRDALSRYAEAMGIWLSRSDGWGVADSLAGFADAATHLGQPERAARLLGAADALYEVAGVALPPHDRINYPQTVALTRERLGDEEFRLAWTAGHGLRMNEAAEMAMDLVRAVAASSEIGQK